MTTKHISTQNTMEAKGNLELALTHRETIHDLKCWPMAFACIRDGLKKAELRKNDRNYQEGDILLEREWEPEEKRYTGEQLYLRVTHIEYVNAWVGDISHPWVVMSVEIISNE